MTALTLVVTNAGISRLAAAQLDGALELAIATVGLSDTAFVPAPTLIALPGEHRRLTAVSGKVVDDATIHLTIRDEVGSGYGIRGLGLFLADGTLFAVYSQLDRIVEKSAQVALFFALDIAFPLAGIDRLTFGATDFLLPPATTTAKGVVELATQAEADAGAPGPLAITAAILARAVGNLATAVVNAVDAASASARSYTDKAVGDLATAVVAAVDSITSRTIFGSGLVKGGGALTRNLTFTVDAATGADLREGIRTDLAVTPAAMQAAGFVYLVEQRTDGASRYRRYSDGIIEMNGISALPTSEAAFTLVFPWPFDTECEGLWSTIINSAQTNDGQSTVQEVALAADRATLFAQNHKTPTADAAGGFRWFARGR